MADFFNFNFKFFVNKECVFYLVVRFVKKEGFGMYIFTFWRFGVNFSGEIEALFDIDVC